MKRKLRPDTRPNWRDPDMPVGVSTKSQGDTYWAPERVSKVAKAKLELSREPHFRDDPTYNMRRKPK